MSYYSYYQQQPQWGTSQYQIVAPPRPSYQPQPNWGGSQYFRAQMGGGYEDYDDLRDEGFFDNIWRGIKDIFSRGFSREDAILWHRRVYGGLVPIDQLDAAQVGAAAGYEAVRSWSTYTSVYRSPLADDREREKEGLAGLAAGEAIKLLSYSSRPRSRHTRREAAEIAAATAERIFAEEYDDPYDVYESGNRLRRRRSGQFRRRSSSFGIGGVRPALIAASSTGGTYMSSQPTGGSYVSTPGSYVQSPGVQYVSTPPVYGQQQPTYVTSTGQQVQYVQAGSPYGSAYTTGGSYMQAQPQYVSTTGQAVTYATTGQPLTYATTGGVYAQQPQYGYQQPYVQPQVAYASPGLVAPQYTRARALSTGYTGAPGYIQY